MAPGLARFLRRADVEVIEVDRPNRAERRSSGKSDPRRRRGRSSRPRWPGQEHSKSKDGAVEAIRVLLVAKRSARGARVKALTQMRHLVITAPDQLRCRLRGLNVTALVAKEHGCGRSARVTRDCRHKSSLFRLRIASTASTTRSPSSTSGSVCSSNRPPPSSSGASGSGPTPRPLCWSPPATTLSVSTQKPPGPTCAGWRRFRRRRERPAGRFRLDRGGDRQANSALWRIVMVRIAHDPRTTAYFEHKVKEGRSKRDVIRILKRYVAREVYHYLPRG